MLGLLTGLFGCGRRIEGVWLTADPNITVQIRGTIRPMLTRTADADERAELWPHLVALYADFDHCQSWTQWQIPEST